MVLSTHCVAVDAQPPHLQVGGFILMHKTDLKRMAPLWLKYSEDVRFDPDVSVADLPFVGCTLQSIMLDLR